MRSIKTLIDDDSGVSPVIGVILMVAITVILAAVIASFVLGLGDTDGPAPNPTIESDFSSGEVVWDITGGDDFAASASTVQLEATVNNASGTDVTVDESFSLDASSNPVATGSDWEINVNVDEDNVKAGDNFDLSTTASGAEIVDWEVEVIWDPADQDSSTIYSDSS